MMKKYQLTDEQYKIIREGLEHLYYIAKDEGNETGMFKVTTLEASLIQQQKAHEKENQEMLDKIHDCYYDVMDEKPTPEQVAEIAPQIREELEHEAEQWGWDDTEIGDRIWNWINENIKHGE